MHNKMSCLLADEKWVGYWFCSHIKNNMNNVLKIYDLKPLNPTIESRTFRWIQPLNREHSVESNHWIENIPLNPTIESRTFRWIKTIIYFFIYAGAPNGLIEKWVGYWFVGFAIKTLNSNIQIQIFKFKYFKKCSQNTWKRVLHVKTPCFLIKNWLSFRTM
jgi:hypothetical protein